MKNPFHFLYYTGLIVLLSFGLVIGLFAINLQNLMGIFVSDKPKPYPKKTEKFVLGELNPKKDIIEKITFIEKPKAKLEIAKVAEKPKEDTTKSTKDTVVATAEPRDSSQQPL